MSSKTLNECRINLLLNVERKEIFSIESRYIQNFCELRMPFGAKQQKQTYLSINRHRTVQTHIPLARRKPGPAALLGALKPSLFCR